MKNIKRKLAFLLVFIIALSSQFIGVFAATADSYEVNNIQSQAKLIAPGTITANLHTTTDVDWYFFTTTTNYRAVSITLTPPGTNVLNTDFFISLYTSNGTLMRNCYITGTKKRSIMFGIENPGSYYIRVSGNSIASGFNYSLKLSIADPNVSLYVDPNIQEQTNWCWATSAKTAGDQVYKVLNNYQNTRTVTQTQICQAVHGNSLNNPALNVGETASAFNWVVDNNIFSGRSAGMNGAFTLSQLFQKIWSKNQPVIMRVGSTNDQNVMGHFLTINGVNLTTSGSTITGGTIEYIDPWDAADITMVYNDVLTSGFRTNDTRVWTHSVNQTRDTLN